MEQLNALVEAIRILKDARGIAGTSYTVWKKLDHAIDYIDAQVASMLADN